MGTSLACCFNQKLFVKGVVEASASTTQDINLVRIQLTCSPGWVSAFPFMSPASFSGVLKGQCSRIHQLSMPLGWAPHWLCYRLALSCLGFCPEKQEALSRHTFSLLPVHRKSEPSWPPTGAIDQELPDWSPCLQISHSPICITTLLPN